MADGQDSVGLSSLTGWVRADSDHVIRGWVTDRAARSRRILVSIQIDDQEAARIVADRLDPKLLDLSEGDGRYAFAFVIPGAYRDGQVHSFAAVAVETGFPLKSKASTFEIAPTAPAPVLEIGVLEFPQVRGSLRGGAFSRTTAFDLWIGEERVITDLPTTLTGPPGEQAFIVQLPSDLAQRALAGLRIAPPGMVEGGLAPEALPLGLNASAKLGARGRLRIAVTAPPRLLTGAAMVVALHSRGKKKPLLVEESVFDTGVVNIDLPESIADVADQVTITLAGHVVFADLPVERDRSGLVRNASFERWSGLLPDDWTVTDGSAASRGFYAFPDHIRDGQGACGEFIHFDRPQDGFPTAPLLSQPLDIVRPGEALEAAVLFRAAGPLRLRLSILSGDKVLGSVVAPAEAGWTYAAQTLNLAGGATDGRLEIAVEGEGDAVDIAGVRLGGGRFCAPLQVEGPRNLVLHPGVDRWPNGLRVNVPKGRREAARGWFVYNRNSAAQVVASALVGGEDLEAPAFAIANDRREAECRLEVSLEPERAASLFSGALTLEVGAPAAARRLLKGGKSAPSQFQTIDRVLLIRRVQEPGGGTRDETLCTIGRKLLVTERYHRFDLPVQLREDRLPQFREEIEANAAAEHLVLFDLRGPFAMAIRGLALRATPSRVGSTGGLGLEDRNIAAQASQIRGLETWLAPEVVRASGAASGPSERVRKSWRWDAAILGSVEVAICVHNAVEDTIAGLVALDDSTTVPHTVALYDDASSPQTTRRLMDFIADKPWMRLIRQDENLGYTRTADRAVREAETDWVVLMNSDTLATPGWLEGLLEAAASREGVAMAGPVSNAASFQSVPEIFSDAGGFATNRLPPGVGPDRMAALVAAASEKAFPEAPLLNGFCALIRRQAFLEVGGFNPGAFPEGYGEENDLCLRLIKAGWFLVIADHVYIHHSKSMSFGSARRAELSKAGSSAVRALHPDVDIQALTAAFAQLPTLVRLRAAVRERLDVAASERWN